MRAPTARTEAVGRLVPRGVTEPLGDELLASAVSVSGSVDARGLLPGPCHVIERESRGEGIEEASAVDMPLSLRSASGVPEAPRAPLSKGGGEAAMS